MKASTEVRDYFQCSLERAFQAPILGDATRFLTGTLFQPAVVRFEDDETWGKKGGIRYPVTDGNFLVRKGRMATDEVLARKENHYWSWTVYDFTTKTLFFTTRGVGEWFAEPQGDGSVAVRYIYTFHARHWLLQPINWLFVKIQMRGLMKIAIKGIRQQAESGEPFVYD